MKGLRKFFASEAPRPSLTHWSPEVEVRWWVDVQAPDSLRLIYDLSDPPNGDGQKHYLYLAPQDAAVIGAILTAWAASHGEKA